MTTGTKSGGKTPHQEHTFTTVTEHYFEMVFPPEHYFEIVFPTMMHCQHFGPVTKAIVVSCTETTSSLSSVCLSFLYAQGQLMDTYFQLLLHL